MNKQENKNLLARMFDSLFPRSVDFYGLLNSQCDIVVEAVSYFDKFMNEHNADDALQVRQLEHQADELKHHNMDELNRSFATPIDREDILRSIVSLDDIIGYAKTTVREMELLQVTPDQPMQDMATLILEGTVALQTGYAKLKRQPLDAEPDAHRAHKTERKVEKVYRHAVAQLFDEQRLIQTFEAAADQSIAQAMTSIVRVLRRRELYRHLSNAADRIEIAAETLHNIIVKVT
jgi:uncharacterized protein Yka (UPF0111/DUF47 family)